jgi:phage-related protein
MPGQRVVMQVEAGAGHYLAKFAEAVYVLRAFEKRTRRTPNAELDLARQRLRGLITQRARRKG